MRGPRAAMKSGPRLPQLEKALAQKRRPNTAKNNLKKKKSTALELIEVGCGWHELAVSPGVTRTCALNSAHCRLGAQNGHSVNE